MDWIESRIGIRFEIGQPAREDCVRVGAEAAGANEAIAPTVRTPPFARFARAR